MYLLSEEKGFEIEEMKYLPSIKLDETLANVRTVEEFNEFKRTILSHIFTIRKENR